MNFQRIALLLAGLAFSSPAFAFAGGNEVGNGGGVWVCGSSLLTQSWTKSVDLLEAENVYDLQLQTFPGQSVDGIVDAVKARLLAALSGEGFERWNSAQLSQMFDRLDYLRAHPPMVVDVPSPLPIIHDALYIQAPSLDSCRRYSSFYGQVINFLPTGTVEVDRRLFNTLSPVVQAALVVHEAVYFLRRARFGDDNSLVSRAVVGLAFSTISMDELKERLRSLSSVAPAPGEGFGTYEISAIASPTGVYPRALASQIVSISAVYGKGDASLGQATDPQGSATILIPDQIADATGLSLNFSRLDSVCIQLNGLNYCGPMTTPFQDVPLLAGPAAPYSCTEITVNFPSVTKAGRIAINCFMR